MSLDDDWLGLFLILTQFFVIINKIKKPRWANGAVSLKRYEDKLMRYVSDCIEWDVVLLILTQFFAIINRIKSPDGSSGLVSLKRIRGDAVRFVKFRVVSVGTVLLILTQFFVIFNRIKSSTENASFKARVFFSWLKIIK